MNKNKIKHIICILSCLDMFNLFIVYEIWHILVSFEYDWPKKLIIINRNHSPIIHSSRRPFERNRWWSFAHRKQTYASFDHLFFFFLILWCIHPWSHTHTHTHVYTYTYTLPFVYSYFIDCRRKREEEKKRFDIDGNSLVHFHLTFLIYNFFVLHFHHYPIIDFLSFKSLNK
jgi:hypothetical protein